MVNQLHEVLIEEYKKGGTVVLIVDEAQNMPVETLENLRMLSNLETATDKLIQIVLIGQPEFDDKLNRHELRQLRQRIAIRTTILPLTREESERYIKHRLSKVMLKDEPVITKGAIKEIVRYSKGIPRVINVVCDNAFITGYGYQKKPVSGKDNQGDLRRFPGEQGQGAEGEAGLFLPVEGRGGPRPPARRSRHSWLGLGRKTCETSWPKIGEFSREAEGCTRRKIAPQVEPVPLSAKVVPPAEATPAVAQAATAPASEAATTAPKAEATLAVARAALRPRPPPRARDPHQRRSQSP